jgi:hypothetical protein
VKALSLSIVSALSGLLFVGFAAQEVAALESGGTLRLYEGVGSGTQCTIDIQPGVHSIYMGDTSCKNDEAESFKLEEMKSAVWILFGSEDWGEKCPLSNYTEGWQDRIKTVKNNVTTPVISFEDLGRLNPNPPKVLKPGVVFDYEKDEGGVSHKGKLSCVTTVWCPASMENPCDGVGPK